MQNMYYNLTGSDYKDIGLGLFGGATKFFGSQEERKAAEAERKLIFRFRSAILIARRNARFRNLPLFSW